MLGRDRVGTVYIRSGIDELAGRMRVFGVVLLGILTGCGLIALVVSARLQRWITAPILDLARTARLVTSDRNFALRATPIGFDEVGALVEDFNRMLSLFDAAYGDPGSVEHRQVLIMQDGRMLAVRATYRF